MSRILLVEDNESIVMGLQYLLENEGFMIKIAENVKGASRLLETDLRFAKRSNRTTRPRSYF